MNSEKLLDRQGHDCGRLVQHHWLPAWAGSYLWRCLLGSPGLM